MVGISLRQLLQERLSNPPFVVFPLLPKGGKLFVYAPKKHYKSMLLFNICYDFAEGSPILSRWPIDAPCAVLLIEQEIGKFMARARFEKIASFRGNGAALDNIIVVSKERRIKLDDPEGFELLRTLIREHQPQIVALDPIRKFHRSDENDSTSITKVVDQLDKLVEEFGVTFLIAHHMGHESVFPNAPKHMRGSSVWGDEADTVINLSKPIKTGPERHNIIRVTVEDIRHAEAPEPFDLEFNKDTHCFGPYPRRTQ